MPIAQQIQDIIAKRRPIAKKVEEAQERLRALSEALRALSTQREQILALQEPAIGGRLNDIDLEPLQIKIAAELESLEKLKSRFTRETINIGVIGRARQGKSRLLQSLSGLSSREIPDGDQQHCTGVRSKICHNPGVEPYAEVTFYSEREFLDEVIAPYYRQLRLGPPPLSLNTIPANPPLPPPDDQAGLAVPGSERAHLGEILRNLHQYRRWFTTPSPHRIPLADVRQFVAQDTPTGSRTYDYLAVREVKIMCEFPHEDIGHIALIDMPGLGDTGIGDQERLVKALGEEVDVVLFVRMPHAVGDSWLDVDTQLYDLARSALLDIPLERWSFMVLNRLDPVAGKGDNTTNCRNLQETIFTKGHISVVSCLTANCKEPREVSSVVLQQVLDYLARQMSDLDQQYTFARQEQLAALKQVVDAALVKASQVFGKNAASINFSPMLMHHFDLLWKSLTTGLETLLRELDTQRGKLHPLLDDQAKRVIEACRTDNRIPSLEDVLTKNDELGGYLPAYAHYLHLVRTHLTYHFLQLDKVLAKVTQQAKERVAQVLMEKGQLQGLTPYTGEMFLQALEEQIQTAGDDLQLQETENYHPSDLKRLKEGIHILTTFELSYRGFIQYRLRKEIDVLSPNRTQLVLGANPSAQMVHNNLVAAHERAVFLVEEPLETWLQDATEAVFAVVEEFVDQILRADEARSDWADFYSVMQAEVWPDDFKKPEEHLHLRNRWQALIAQALQANQAVVF